MYAAGGVVTASEIAIGGVAKAPLAIGNVAEGARTVLLPEGPVDEATRFVILGELTARLGNNWLARLLWKLVGGI